MPYCKAHVLTVSIQQAGGVFCDAAAAEEVMDLLYCLAEAINKDYSFRGKLDSLCSVFLFCFLLDI